MEIVTFVELDIDATTFRFGYASEEQIDYDHIPSLKSVSVRPAIIDPGESIGERESVTINCIDHLHRFDADDFNNGTFWTKFRARYQTIEGAPLRVLRGQRGQLLAEMDTYLYVAESFQISRTGATLVAKDPLSLLNSKAAQAPRVTQGELSAPLAAAGMAFTLTPAGIGNLQYPAGPAKAVLGGSEIITFTRVGDNFTITSRGENTEAEDHDEGTKVQLALWYEGQLPSVIVNDLLVNYSNVDPAWITIADWQQSVDAFINRVYTAVVADPTAVKTLLNELCEQIGLIFYWDALAKQIRLRPLLAAATSRAISEDLMIEGTFTSTEQPDKRVSEVWTYYGQRDPTKNVDETNNYRRVVVKLSPNAGDFIQPAIRKIFSRWIAFTGRTTAERLNDLIVSRYQIPPRKLKFELFRNEGFLSPPPGTYIDVSHWFLVDDMGDPEVVNAQVVSAKHDDSELEYEAEEIRFAGEDLEPEVDKYVFIESDVFNINLRTLYNQIYTPPLAGDNIYFIVETGVKVGSQVRTGPAAANTGTPSMTVGDWPEAVDLFLIINGRVQGIGGDGSDAPILTGDSLDARQGNPGGTAIYTRRAITIENNGQIWGGGGGGSSNIYGLAGLFGAVGGGGAGYLPGRHGNRPGDNPAQDGTTETFGFGAGPSGTHGGNPGEAGEQSEDTPPGPAGIAIDGVSFVTFSVAGSVLGPQVN